MPNNNKPFIKYAVLCLLVFIVVNLVLGKIIVDEVNDHLTETHLRRLPETVQTLFEQNRNVTQWFLQPPGTALPEPMVSLSQALLHIPGIFRLKLWDKHGTVLWSDNAELIGKNFAQNQHFQQASNGKVTYNNEGIRKDENETEQGQKVIVEVYLPVYEGTRIIGVIELYESNNELALMMMSSTETIWTCLAVAGVGLYLLLLAAYLLSHDVVTDRRQKLGG